MEAFHAFVSIGNLSAREFRSEFNKVLEGVALKLQGDSISRHLGDPRLWPELTEIYKNLTYLLEKRRVAPKNTSIDVYTEKTLHSKDGLLFGQIDAYFIYPDGIELVDYKSGSMTSGDLPKEDYANQLYFYAYLIWENYGVYPRSLTLIGKNSASLQVPPSQTRSEELAVEMRKTLKSYNDQVAKKTPQWEFANPSSDNCLLCDAKPVCVAFWRALPSIELPPWAHVAIGLQSAPMVRSKLGGACLELTVERSSLNTPVIKVTRIFEERHPGLRDKVGQRLLLTNIKQISSSNPRLVEASNRSLILLLGSDL